MGESKEFYAFISYKREDEKWAKWLQHKLEHYRFPTQLNGRNDLPKNIRPTFRDVTDLSLGLLAEEINKALHDSEWLIVICSPRSAKSPWVCKEAQTFIDLGRADHIIPFIIEGTPFSNDTATECYPKALLNLIGGRELLATNINEMGRDAAVVKVVARMFNLRFDTLWQRHEREKIRLRKIYTICGLVAFFSILSIALWMYWQKQQVLKANWEMMESHARMIAEKAREEIKKGNTYDAILALLEVVPNNGNKPFVAEVEAALRIAIDTLQTGHWNYRYIDTNVDYAYISDDEKHLIESKNGKIQILDTYTLQHISDSTIVKNLALHEKYEMDKITKRWEISNVHMPNTEIIDYNHAKNIALIKRIVETKDENAEEDYTLMIWDCNSDNILLSINNDGLSFNDILMPGVWTTSFSHDGRLLAISFTDGGGLLININDLSQKKLFCGGEYCDHYSNTYTFSGNNLLVHFSRFEATLKIINPQTLAVVDSILPAIEAEITGASLNSEGNKCLVFLESELYMYYKKNEKTMLNVPMNDFKSCNTVCKGDTVIDQRYILECKNDGIYFKDIKGEYSDWVYSNRWGCSICDLIHNNRYVVISIDQRFSNDYAVLDLVSGIEMYRRSGTWDVYYSEKYNRFLFREINENTFIYDFLSFEELIKKCKEMTKGMSLSLFAKKKFYLD